MQISKEEIRDFYNEYVDYQSIQLNNERHYYVLELLKKNGLKKNSKVVDLGCGIGAFTALVARYCKKGIVKGYDLSDKSIEFASNHYSKLRNVAFITTDITSHSFAAKYEIDYVLLIDVLEHIPRDEHEFLFKKIESILNDNTKLIINIPYYAALQYEKNNNKDVLQIIDEPVELFYLLSLSEKLNLEIKQVETFDMWQKEEYQFIVMEKKKDYVFTRLIPKKLNLIKKVIRKLKTIF